MRMRVIGVIGMLGIMRQGYQHFKIYKEMVIEFNNLFKRNSIDN